MRSRRGRSSWLHLSSRRPSSRSSRSPGSTRSSPMATACWSRRRCRKCTISCTCRTRSSRRTCIEAASPPASPQVSPLTTKWCTSIPVRDPRARSTRSSTHGQIRMEGTSRHFRWCWSGPTMWMPFGSRRFSGLRIAWSSARMLSTSWTQIPCGCSASPTPRRRGRWRKLQWSRCCGVWASGRALRNGLLISMPTRRVTSTTNGSSRALRRWNCHSHTPRSREWAAWSAT
mmetsp:Transcript_11267/g.30152  ORF Transcript_11267/g.30152 Transcript_11267/m.30152 type:complete len:230 (+) Transcript_11267:122-811(+)